MNTDHVSGTVTEPFGAIGALSLEDLRTALADRDREIAELRARAERAERVLRKLHHVSAVRLSIGSTQGAAVFAYAGFEHGIGADALKVWFAERDAAIEQEGRHG